MATERYSIMQFAWQIVAVALVLSVLLFRGKRDKTGRKYVFPPGPKGLPIIGNTWDLPPFGASALTKKWAKQYGEMYGHSSLADRQVSFTYCCNRRCVPELFAGSF
jgi:hypothetical protein